MLSAPIYLYEWIFLRLHCPSFTVYLACFSQPYKFCLTPRRFAGLPLIILPCLTATIPSGLLCYVDDSMS